LAKPCKALSGALEINILHLQTGIYFVKIFTEAGEVTKKVLKE